MVTRTTVRSGLLGLALLTWVPSTFAGSHGKTPKPEFQTSDRCLACHNGLTTASGKDVSIGIDWRATIMANSSRDPYWQGSVRRETLDHPQAKAKVEDECSICHMPITRYEAKVGGHNGEVFSHLPFRAENKDNAKAEDGVSCSVCHQIANEKLGTAESFVGGFVVDAPKDSDDRPEYGPFTIKDGRARIMRTSTEGYRPTDGPHIQDSALCATCHTLYTTSIRKDGGEGVRFPEQVPYQEWQHSGYRDKETCQSCHMPEADEESPISAVLGEVHTRIRQHTFVGANFFMLRMLNLNARDLSVAALPQELSAEADRTVDFLQQKSARLTIRSVTADANGLRAEIFVENLTGHKLPTAYPSRRAWLHFVVKDAKGNVVFESGGLNPDGSIRGNDNDADPARFEPHYREITKNDEVQIYEPILKDDTGRVTTGLLSTIGYLKDNRLLPAGFDKKTAEPDIAVVGDAREDPAFQAGGDSIVYSVNTADATGPFHIEVELWYQPIGFRWAHNLAPYHAFEPERFVGYYNAMAPGNAAVLAKAEATR